MNKEIWKDIPNYEGRYKISSFGRVKSMDTILLKNGKYPYVLRGKILKTHDNGHGYLKIVLWKGSKRITSQIQSLVAQSFLNHIPSGHKLVVDHIDKNTHNNNVENLQIITHRYNCSKDRSGYSNYTGVYRNKKSKTSPYKSLIVVGKKQFYLGVFKNEIEAHNAYQKALKELEA